MSWNHQKHKTYRFGKLEHMVRSGSKKEINRTLIPLIFYSVDMAAAASLLSP